MFERGLLALWESMGIANLEWGQVLMILVGAENNVDAVFENVNVQVARWVRSDDDKKLAEFTTALQSNLARDAADELVYLAPTRVNLQLTEERWPGIRFATTRETLLFAE